MAGMLYDCHTHLFPERRMGGLMRWIHRAIPDLDVPIDITAEQAIGDLRAMGARRWANLLFPIAPGEAPALHAFGSSLAERTPEITPFGGVHVEDADPRAIVEEAVERYQMAGLKFHPFVQGFTPWDVRLSDAIEYAASERLPTFIHTGYDEWYGNDLDRDGLETMVATHPTLPVVLPHLGFPDLGWAFGLANRHENVWLDLTNVPGSFDWVPGADSDDLRQELFDGVASLKDRVIVGTDYPAGMGNLDQIVAQYHQVGFSDSLLEHVMVVSTKRFFDTFGRSTP